ncbi:MAG TPA: tetratricopeptide repeat protein, partial [Pirellulales bacterium]|nr:tetratricopeptide repeat protein [Pirellulales bacterium]
MKRLNLKLLISLVVATVCLGLGLIFVHAMQLKSNEGSLKKEAEALVQDGKKDEALKRYTAYLQQNQNDPAVYRETAKLALEIANTNQSNETLNQAYRELEKGVRYNPDDAELRASYAEFLMRLATIYPAEHKLFEDAITQLKILTTAPKSPNRKYVPKLDLMLANCYEQLAYTDKAMELYASIAGYDLKSNTFDRTKARAPNEVDPYNRMAFMMREKLEPRQPKQADAVMEQLVTVNKDSFKAHLYRAVYCFQRYLNLAENSPAKEPMLATAKDEMALAVKLSPEDADVILWAAEMAMVDKDYKKSEQWLIRGLELFPKNVQMYLAVKTLMLNQDRVADARKQIEQGLKNLPKNAELLLALADIEMQQHDFDGARGAL